LYDTLKEENYS